MKDGFQEAASGKGKDLQRLYDYLNNPSLFPPNEEGRIDMKNLDLRGARIKGNPYKKLSLEKIDFSGSDLSCSRLYEVWLSKTRLLGTRFTGGRLEVVRFDACAFGETVFDGVHLFDVYFSRCTPINSSFRKTKGKGLGSVVSAGLLASNFLDSSARDIRFFLSKGGTKTHVTDVAISKEGFLVPCAPGLKVISPFQGGTVGFRSLYKDLWKSLPDNIRPPWPEAAMRSQAPKIVPYDPAAGSPRMAVLEQHTWSENWLKNPALS